MKIIDPSVEILTPINREMILTLIEKAGRVCYKSEEKITEGSASKIIPSWIKSGHESVIEHYNISVKFICDRGVTHELVRHRLASFSQESTRYCNYGAEKFGKEITVVKPSWYIPKLEYCGDISAESTVYNQVCKQIAWEDAMIHAERAYFEMLKNGATAQEARAVLPNSLKTEIVVTANLREFRHILNLRCSKAAHPDIRYIMLILLKELNGKLPEIFEDIALKYLGDVNG
jgi:thymidylate synthase (FAD)